MRKAVLLAAALALSASAAHAQGRDADDDDDAWRDRREYRAERGRDRDDHHGPEERGGRFGGRGGGGARFFVRSGETRVGVVCDRGESMRSCLDVALTLLDKAKQVGSAGPSATGGSSSPGARP
jgi:hypothetical protein